MTTYTTVFGGNTISPALDSYISYTLGLTSPLASFTGTISGTALTVSAVVGTIAIGQTIVGAGIPVNVTIISGTGLNWVISQSLTLGPIPMQSGTVVAQQLVWPQETAPNSNLAAQIIEIGAASTVSSGIILPPANMVSVGQFLLINNLSSFNQAVFAFGGAVIVSAIAPGAVFFLYLQNNTTTAGVWFGFQYGSAISNPSAAALAGAGLIATGTTLSQDIQVNTFTVSPVNLTIANRAQLINWAGGAGTINLPSSAAVGASFYVQIRNSSTSSITVAPNGSDNINGNPTQNLQPSDSAFFVTDGAGNWFTIGLGTVQPTFFNYQAISVIGLSVPITLGVTAGTSLNKIAYKFTGAPTAAQTVVLPAFAQTYWINNATTGALTFQVAYPVAAGTTQVVPQGIQEILYSDGANVINAVSGSGLSNPVSIAQGGTGAATAGTALINLGGTSTGVALFTAASAAAAQAALAAPSIADTVALAMSY